MERKNQNQRRYLNKTNYRDMLYAAAHIYRREGSCTLSALQGRMNITLQAARWIEDRLHSMGIIDLDGKYTGKDLPVMIDGVLIDQDTKEVITPSGRYWVEQEHPEASDEGDEGDVEKDVRLSKTPVYLFNTLTFVLVGLYAVFGTDSVWVFAGCLVITTAAAWATFAEVVNDVQERRRGGTD